MALNIKRAIKARGLKAQELAEKMGITSSTLSGIMRGNPSYSTLQRVANALDCDVTELFDTPSRPMLPAFPNEMFTVTAGSPLALSVKRAIESCKLNITQVAERIGFSRANLSCAINGSPRLRTLELIADVLCCDVVELLPPPAERRLPIVVLSANTLKQEELLKRKRARQSS